MSVSSSFCDLGKKRKENEFQKGMRADQKRDRKIVVQPQSKKKEHNIGESK